MATVLFGHDVKFMALISYLQKNIALLIVYISVELLFFVFSGPSYWWVLLSVAEIVSRGQTPMLLVIAETILCLDRIHYLPDQFFMGSLLL